MARHRCIRVTKLWAQTRRHKGVQVSNVKETPTERKARLQVDPKVEGSLDLSYEDWGTVKLREPVPATRKVATAVTTKPTPKYRNLWESRTCADTRHVDMDALTKRLAKEAREAGFASLDEYLASARAFNEA